MNNFIFTYGTLYDITLIKIESDFKKLISSENSQKTSWGEEEECDDHSQRTCGGPLVDNIFEGGIGGYFLSLKATHFCNIQ